MSLLEDVFLQDEADEAQELERVIEGDEYDERPRSRSVTPEEDENIIGEDEAEEEKRRVDPTSNKTKRVIKNPRFILNPARLTGPRGIQVIREHFKDFKFKGKGHEKDDLDMVLKKLEHWAYRLYPKFQFDDCLKKIESLGKKRPVMVHLTKIRNDQILTEETVVQKDSSDEETQNEPPEEDEFDKLLQQQIEIARATPAPGSVKKAMGTPKQDRSPFTMPKATSSPSISDEQKERMIRNRKLAEERRLARLEKMAAEANTTNANNISENEENPKETNVTSKKHNRSNVIDSSDEECDITAVNQSVSVDMHINSTEKLANKSIESKTIETEQTVDVNMDGIVADKDNIVPTNEIEQITEQEKVNDESLIHNGINNDESPINNVENNDVNVKENHVNQEIDKINSEDFTVNTDEPEISGENTHNLSNSENQVKSSSENEIHKDNIINSEENITKEIQAVSTENTESKTGEKLFLNEKESITEVVEDIMDVDFSDDF